MWPAWPVWTRNDRRLEGRLLEHSCMVVSPGLLLATSLLHWDYNRLAHRDGGEGPRLYGSNDGEILSAPDLLLNTA